jgi:lipoyl(octanoyl) transferase
MIQYIYLGRVDYGEALRLQQELVALRTAGRIGNVLLLLEHPPVLTLGRNANRSNILASDEILAARGVTLHEINRGGDVTYHGPGQLIGYPIFDLRSLRNPSGHNRLGPVDFVRLMEEALIRLCGEFGVTAGRICGLTGVWCWLPEPQPASFKLDCEAPTSSKGLPSTGSCDAPTLSAGRKIAAIGIHVARGVTSHGFAFNVTTDLRDFTLINPCGITDRPVTSLEREVPDPGNLPRLEILAERAAREFGLVFNEPVALVESLAELRALADAEPELPASNSSEEEFPAPVFPAQDTPLQIPPEIERLRHRKDRPISA